MTHQQHEDQTKKSIFEHELPEGRTIGYYDKQARIICTTGCGDCHRCMKEMDDNTIEQMEHDQHIAFYEEQELENKKEY